VVLSET
jgi:hypothetical protein